MRPSPFDSGNTRDPQPDPGRSAPGRRRAVAHRSTPARRPPAEPHDPPPAADPSSAVGPPSPEAAKSPLDRYAVATADEPVRIPSWMREPEVEHELTRSERLRLRWGRHGGTLLGAVGVLLVLVLVGGLALGGFGLVQRVARRCAAASRSGVPRRRARSPADRRQWQQPRPLFVATPAEPPYAEAGGGRACRRRPSSNRAVHRDAGRGPRWRRCARRWSRVGSTVSDALRGSGARSSPLLAPARPANGVRRRPDRRQPFCGYASRGSPSRPSGTGSSTYAARRPGHHGLPVHHGRGRHADCWRSPREFVWVVPVRPVASRRRTRRARQLVTLRDKAVWQVPYPDDVPTSSGRGPLAQLGAGRDPPERRTAPSAVDGGAARRSSGSPNRCTRHGSPAVPTPGSDVYDEI